MKKNYISPSVEFIYFGENDIASASNCKCDTVCVADEVDDCPPDNECKFCNYLVCTPVDVIIG